MNASFDALSPEHPLSAASAALRQLGSGRLLVEVRFYHVDGDADDNALADAYTVFLGYCELEMAWVAVEPRELPRALAVLASRDMAYEDQVMDEAVAREAVDRWLAAFPQPYRAYTNGDLLMDHAKPHPSGAGYNPIVGATFDTGAVVIGTDIIGFFWATDED